MGIGLENVEEKILTDTGYFINILEKISLR
jgi:hypothetical protein